MDKTQFSNWLSDQLREREISSAELARRSGISEAAVSMVLNEQRGPGTDFLIAVARGLDLPREVLFRAAGLLHPDSPVAIAEGRTEYVISDDTAELVHLFTEMPEDEQQRVLTIVRALRSLHK